MELFNPLWLVVVGAIVLAVAVYLYWPKNKVVIPKDASLPGPSAAPPDMFIDRDDLMTWIALSKFTHTVTLDGATVHGGFGPALAYVSGEDTPDENIKRA